MIYKKQNKRNILSDWENIIFHLPYAFLGRRMIINKWLDWMNENEKIDEIYSEIGKPESNQDKDWLKKVSKSNLYKNFVEDKIAPGEMASSEIGNMYTASIFMSLISSLVDASNNDKKFKDKKIGFISLRGRPLSEIYI